jgi:hypothetical protein
MRPGEMIMAAGPRKKGSYPSRQRWKRDQKGPRSGKCNDGAVTGVLVLGPALGAWQGWTRRERDRAHLAASWKP